MKKIILGSLILLVIGVISSCQKEIKNTSIKESQSTQTASKPVIYHAEWDEWGRAKKGCKGWGLCNFSDCWFCDDGEALHTADVIFDDQTKEGFMIIELDPSDPVEANAITTAKAFYVDEDIDNPNSILHMGIYPFDQTVGEYGGYRLNITIK